MSENKDDIEAQTKAQTEAYNKFQAGLEKRQRRMSGAIVEDALDFIEFERPDFLKKAKLIMNLFAGDAPESVEILHRLNVLGNSGAQVKAVDQKGSEPGRLLVSADSPNYSQFEYIVSDALEYLDTLPAGSADMVTLFGADIYTNDFSLPESVLDERKKALFEKVLRVLKPDGIVSAPTLKDVFGKTEASTSFEAIDSVNYQKK